MRNQNTFLLLFILIFACEKDYVDNSSQKSSHGKFKKIKIGGQINLTLACLENSLH